MSGVGQWDDPTFNLELFLCTDLLKLKSLHYGYWSDGGPAEGVSRDEVVRAQERYTETLVAMIPEEVQTILDVGCGMGDVSHALALRGHQVTAISPDRNHAQFFRSPEREGIDFQNVRFEDFSSDKLFDLVLMSESQGYFPMELGLRQSRACLRDHGFLLVSGIFKSSDSTEVFREGQRLDEYLELARSNHLDLISREDISEKVLPTLDQASRLYNEYLPPLATALSRLLGPGGNRKLRILKWVFAKEVGRLDEVRGILEQRIDPALFRQHLSYVRLLFKKRTP